jgi:hypothetical protein
MINKMTKYIVYSALICLMSCGGSSEPESTELSLEELQAVSTELFVGDLEVTALAVVSRNFILKESTDSSLSVVLKLIEPQFFNFKNIQAEAIYVINGDQIWYSELKPLLTNNNGFELNYRADDGPKWNTDIQVDIVIEISTHNTIEYLKLSDQYVFGLY